MAQTTRTYKRQYNHTKPWCTRTLYFRPETSQRSTVFSIMER